MLSCRLIATLLLPVLFGGCSGSKKANIEPDTACMLLPAEVTPSNLTVATADEMGEQALLLVGRRALITFDCAGRARPGLAAAWTRRNGGKLWTFVLSENEQVFVPAPELVRRWRSHTAQYAGLDSMHAGDAYRLDIHFDAPVDQPPYYLASPDFAVSIEPAPRLMTTLGRDERDVLADGVDALVTRDPEVIDYARSRPEWSVAPLPWDRIYVLAAPGKTDATAWPKSLLEGLALDAVRVDARGFDSSVWWDDLASCPWIQSLENPTDSDNAGSSELVYERNDPAARDVTERLVALSNYGRAPAEQEAVVQWLSRLRPAARPLDSDQFNRRVEAGTDAAYIFAVERMPYDACTAAQTIVNRAPWLVDHSGRRSLRLVPLVETRLHVIARRGVGVSVDWFGRLILN